MQHIFVITAYFKLNPLKNISCSVFNLIPLLYNYNSKWVFKVKNILFWIFNFGL